MSLKSEVQDADSALVYMVECTLATVDSIALRKRLAAGEFSRQISIAQTGIDWIVNLRIDVSKACRIRDVIFDHNRSVQNYANELRRKVE